MHKENFFKKNKFIILAFCIPFLLMTIAFALMKVAPFGDKQILMTDLWHQYYPFLVDLQEKLKNGESLFWSWTQGGGVNYFALMSYYLISPLNFLSVLIPKEFLREFLMFSVSARVACAGMFMAIFLRSIYKKNDMSIVIFGCSFSFCAFFMGYYWNTIWLDAVCLTPLVVLGAVKLLKENKFRLYVITLALSLLTNYYIGFFTCIFMLILFICYSIIKWDGRKPFFTNLFKMGIFSLLAVGITAVLLIPAFMGLQNTYASESEFPAAFAINIGETNDLNGVLKALMAVTANLISFRAPGTASYDGLPNIACGTLVLVLAFLFFLSKEIPRREKVVSGCLVLFFMLSFIIRQLDYIWHGFHFTNMVPYRFSYLLSFVLIVMAFQVFTLWDRIFLRELLLTLPLLACVLGFAVVNEAEKYAVVGTTVLALAFCTLLLFNKKKMISRKVFLAILTIIVLGESGVTAYLGVSTTRVTSMDQYPSGGKDTEKIIETMNQMEKETSEMWRAEMSSCQTLNDGSLNGYRGLSMFSSMANVNMTQFFENMGLMGWKSGNRYSYGESSPVANVFMNLKYIISRDGMIGNSYDLREVASEGNVKLYKNEHYLPMGFMTDDFLSQWEINENEDEFNPFETQSEFFRLATGVEEPLYTPVEVTTQGHTDFEQFPVEKTAYGNYKFHCNDSSIIPSLKWNFETMEEGIYFVYAKITEGEAISVTRRSTYEAEPQKCGDFDMKRGYIACIGEVPKGEIISISTTLPQGQSGTAQVYVNQFHPEVFEKGYEEISKDVMTTTYLTGNTMEGTIEVSQDGLFYTSIPYEMGWSAKVDGEKVEITPVGDALLAFPLSAGSHEIELKFYPRGFWPGLIITLLSLAVFVWLCIRLNRQASHGTSRLITFEIDGGYNEDHTINRPVE